MLWGSRIVVPEELREEVLQLLHVTHQCIVAVKSLARSYIWWPGLDRDIERVTSKCRACQDSQRKPNKVTPHPWTPAAHTWDRIHIDFCGPVDKRMWLVIVDAYSKWIEVIDMGSNITSKKTIRMLQKIFAQFVLCRTLVSDNGPSLVSAEMNTFLEGNGIVHIAVPKYKPICNGLAERAVQSFKYAMEKAGRSNNDLNFNLCKWLLHQRNTPHSTTQESPAKRMFGRPTRTLLALLDPLTNKREKQKVLISRVRTLNVGDRVRVLLNVRSDEWYPGVIVDTEGSKVYVVKSRYGLERRHIDHLALATDLSDDDVNELEPRTSEQIRPEPESEPVQNDPMASKNEQNQAEPNISNNSESNIPQAIESFEQNRVPNNPILLKPEIVLTRQKFPSPTVPCTEHPITRKSARQKSKVDRLEYGNLGGP